MNKIFKTENQLDSSLFEFAVSAKEDHVKIIENYKADNSKDLQLKAIYKIFNIEFDEVCLLVEQRCARFNSYFCFPKDSKLEKTLFKRGNQKTQVSTWSDNKLDSWNDKPAFTSYNENGTINYHSFMKDGSFYRETGPVKITYEYKPSESVVFKKYFIEYENRIYYDLGPDHHSRIEKTRVSDQKTVSIKRFESKKIRYSLHSDNGPAVIEEINGKTYNMYYHHGEYIGRDFGLFGEEYQNFIKNREILS